MPNVVPTWNFAVVHATGKLRPVEGKKELNDLLSKLIAKFESYEGTSYDFSKIDDTYKYGMMNGIIGFELEIELLEGKFKLGQDRSPADKQSLLKKLDGSKGAALPARLHRELLRPPRQGLTRFPPFLTGIGVIRIIGKLRRLSNPFDSRSIRYPHPASLALNRIRWLWPTLSPFPV